MFDAAPCSHDGGLEEMRGRGKGTRCVTTLVIRVWNGVWRDKGYYYYILTCREIDRRYGFAPPFLHLHLATYYGI